LLVSTSEKLIADVQVELKNQLNQLSRKDLATKSLSNSTAILMSNINEAMDLVNAYAAEHLILSCVNAALLAEKVINAGSIFLGNYSPESVGDYASGTNHTLPTNGFARAFSGVSVESFVKKITVQQLSEAGLANIASTVELMAMAEGLDAHANAVVDRSLRIRLTVVAQGPSAAEAADSALVLAHAALMQAPNLEGLSLGIREVEADWDTDDLDAGSLALPARYEIRYRTLVADLTQIG
jgi:hypothetical protein